MTGSELLDEARRLHPHAKRSLLVAWGDWGIPETGEAIFDAIAQARTDHYVIRPSPPPDELFHNAISGMLLDWAESQRTSPYTINIVGESWSGRAYELREVLGRCAMPHSFSLADSTDGRALVAEAGDDGSFPLVILPERHGPARSHATRRSWRRTGSPVNPPSTDFDLVIVGAGPAGLSAAVYGASEGFNTLVVDLGGVGGQATSSSLIRNYLGFSRGVSGRRLAQSAYEQAWVFGAHFTFLQRVTGLRTRGRRVDASPSPTAGACAPGPCCSPPAPRTGSLGIPALEALNGAGVFYGGTSSEAPAMAGREVYVVGGCELRRAGGPAPRPVREARHARGAGGRRSTPACRSTSCTRSRRRPSSRSASAPRWSTAVATDASSTSCSATTATGSEETVDADGAVPHDRCAAEHRLAPARGRAATTPGSCSPAPTSEPTRRWPLDRRPLLLETSMPGVFAAGDVRHGSVKRVATSVGEGSVAIQVLHQLFDAHELEPRGRARSAGVLTEG